MFIIIPSGNTIILPLQNGKNLLQIEGIKTEVANVI